MKLLGFLMFLSFGAFLCRWAFAPKRACHDVGEQVWSVPRSELPMVREDSVESLRSALPIVQLRSDLATPPGFVVTQPVRVVGPGKDAFPCGLIRSHNFSGAAVVLGEGVVGPGFVIANDFVYCRGRLCGSLRVPSVITVRHSCDATVLWLCAYWAIDFFHFFVETVPAVLAVLPYLESHPAAVAVLPAVRSYVTETLALLGVEDRFLTLDPASPFVLAHEIIAPVFMSSGHAAPAAVSEFRGLIFRSLGLRVGVPASGMRAIVVMRRTGRTRVMENHDALVAALRTELPGVPVVEHSAAWSVGYTVRVVSQAVGLVGMHGAGLSYSLFLPPDGFVVEILIDGYMNCCYAELAGVEHIGYWAYVVRNATGRSPVHVDVGAVVELTKEALRGGG